MCRTFIVILLIREFIINFIALGTKSIMIWQNRETCDKFPYFDWGEDSQITNILVISGDN